MAALIHTMKTDLALERVRQAILDGRYRPGEKLRQNQVAQELGLSPTPVREALRRLQAEGLVTHSPHRGVRVTRVGVEEIADVYRLLVVLEGLAARLVAERPDRAATVANLERIQARVEARLQRGALNDWVKISTQFEAVLHAACNSPRLQTVLKGLWDTIPRDPIGVVDSMAASTTAEHCAVLDAIRSGNGDAAERAMRAHVQQSSATRVEFLRQHSSRAT
jgi:DNA-binding GntR family transcriptional regulator